MLQRDYKETNFLTSIRAIAILLVFLIHSGGGGLRGLGPWGVLLVEMGKYGVQIFFVISGYTIFSQFYEEKYSLKGFWLIRIFRISIPYFPILIGIFIYLRLGGRNFNAWAYKFNNGAVGIRNMLAHFSYLSAYSLKYQNTIIGVEWTLAVEVFFYGLFGLLIHYKIFKLNILAFALFGLAFYLSSMLIQPIQEKYDLDLLLIHWMPFSYGYMFYLGGLAYYLRKLLNEKMYTKYPLLKACLSDFVLEITIIIFFYTLIYSNFATPLYDLVEFEFVYATFFILIFFSNDGKLSGLLNNRFLITVGSFSFSFYLIHYIVILNTPQNTIPAVKFIIDLVISTAVSVLWYFIFEKLIYNKIKTTIKQYIAIHG